MKYFLLTIMLILFIGLILSFIIDFRNNKPEKNNYEEKRLLCEDLTPNDIISILRNCEEIDLSNVTLRVKNLYKSNKKKSEV